MAAIMGSTRVDAAELKRLRDRDKVLSALEAAGVDNWEGYPRLGEEEDDDA